MLERVEFNGQPIFSHTGLEHLVTGSPTRNSEPRVLMYYPSPVYIVRVSKL